MITLYCYEPAGKVLHLAGEDLCRHVLGLGTTGCGKTTGLINPVLHQLINWQPKDSRHKVGMLVLDPKDDDTCDKIRAYAHEAGRQDDLVTLGGGGDSYYGYFADFKKLDQVDEFTRRVLYGSREMGENNAYWTEARFGLVNSALTVLLANGKSPTFGRVAEFLQHWFFAPYEEEITKGIQHVEHLLGAKALRSTTRRRLKLAVVDAQNWKALDSRTRELHKSALNNALRTLLSPAANDMFDETKPRRFDPAEALAGKIMVASINAVCHPNLAAMVFKALKHDYYQAVLSRQVFSPEHHRMCGLILDEFPLSVMPEDTENLALLRSKGGFVVACSQGLSSLDEAIGQRRRAALLTNFNSVFYFSSREDQTDHHALLTLGVRELPESPTSQQDLGGLQVLDLIPSNSPTPVCPPGSLARLAPHQAYAKFADGTVTQDPIWLAPRFHDFVPAPPPTVVDDLAMATAELTSVQADQSNDVLSFAMFQIQMRLRGHVLMLTPNVVKAAWQLCRPRTNLKRILARLGPKLRGLDSIPPCWLVGLDRWLRKNPKQAPGVLCVSVNDGVLWVKLDAAWGHWGAGPIVIPEAINCFVYPSLWRPLLPRHQRQLKVERPDLRAELQSLPQVEK